MSGPILVTGSHRSGTTWVGRMLCRSGEAGYIHEPLCPNRSPGWLTDGVPRWFIYIATENEGPFVAPMQRVFDLRYPFAASLLAVRHPKQLARQLPEIARSAVYRIRRLRPLLKDPFALFSTEWLADRFGARPIVMIRKPVAFVSSIKKLNWGFDYEREWMGQPLLMRDHLESHRSSFEGYQGEVDLVGEGIVMWNTMYDFVNRLRERRPEFIYLRYEDLAADPIAGYRELYSALDLTWDTRVRDRIAGYSDSANPKDVSPRRRRAIKRDSTAAADTWRSRLTPAEAARVETETAEVAGAFYPEG